MSVQESDSVRYFTFETLASQGVVHAAIMRHGGISPHPWASLNVGGTVGDDPFRVTENRRRTFHALGLPFESMYDVWQSHGKEVVFVEAPRPSGVPHIRADVMLTNHPEVTLFMRFADCVPIFLFDPVRAVVGLAHAGWKGTLQRVAAVAVQAMQEHYHCQPGDILAGLGPSIAVHHYPIGEDVRKQVEATFGADAARLLVQSQGENGESKVQFDLWSANRLVLEQAGVRQVEVAGICTACQVQDWYSHRAEDGQTGRFGVVISLK